MNAHLILVQLLSKCFFFNQSKTKDWNKTVENYVHKITEIGYKTFSIKSNKKTKQKYLGFWEFVEK